VAHGSRVSPFVQATVINFFFSLSLSGYVLLPLHIAALGGTAVEIGAIMGLYPAIGIVCQPLLGPWVDAVGRRPFMLFGVSALIVASLVATASGAIPWLALTRLLQGLGYSAFFVAITSYVIDIVPRSRRGWALGIFGASGFTSTAIAPLVAEGLIRRFGFSALFALSTVLAAGTAAAVVRLPEARRHGTVPTLRGARSMRGGLDDVFQLPMFVTVFFGLGAGTIFTFLPTFAERLGVRTLSLFYTAYAAAAIAVRVGGGQLIDTRGRRAVIVPSMFIQAVAAALLATIGMLVGRPSATPVLPVLFLAGLLSGAAHGFLYPGLAALVVDRTPHHRRATVIGVFSAMFLVGQAGGAFTFGYVAHALGYASMWSVLAAGLLFGSAISLKLERPVTA